MIEIEYTDEEYILAATHVVSAFVANNSVPVTQLPDLIADVHAALRALAPPEPAPEPEPLKPAVSVKRSIGPDYLTCLEDGKKFKSLKRHLRTKYNMTPEQYREKWGLPADYPMVAPNYAAARSELARKLGLGQMRRRGEAIEPLAEPEGAPTGEQTPPGSPLAPKKQPRAKKIDAPDGR